MGTTFESPPGTTLESPLAPPAPDRATAEAEIAAFMLDRIVAQEIEGAAAGARDALIVWAPVEPGGEGETAFDRLPKFDEENPIRVWAYGAGEAVEVGGDAAARREAIREYRRNTIEADATDDIVAWGLYEFGVLALDEAAGQATVYRDASCGRLCASGVVYTLVRGADGVVVGERDGDAVPGVASGSHDDASGDRTACDQEFRRGRLGGAARGHRAICRLRVNPPNEFGV